MINLLYNDNGISFSPLIKNDEIVPFEKWVETDDCIYYFPLSNLVDNGLAEIQNENCFVPSTSVYALEDSDKFLLGLPKAYDKAMRLKADGLLSDSDLKYKLQLLTFVPGGDIMPFKRYGNVIESGNDKYLLSYPQYQLFEKVEDFNKRPETEKTRDYNYRALYEIKRLGNEANCKFDEYIANENIIVPDKVKIDIQPENEGIKVLPSIDLPCNEKFQQTFEKFRMRADYPIQDENDNVNRIVLDDKMVDGLRHLKERRCRFESKEEARDLIEHPTEYFDPETFNLDEFYSDRVIEIGLYKPRFAPFVSAYKSQWLPGATVEDMVNGTTNITIEDTKKLEELNLAIECAEKENKPIVEFEQAKIGIEDAKYLSKMAEEQLEHPKIPIEDEKVEKKEEKKLPRQRQVLVIEENEEELTFSQNKEISSKEYTLYKDPMLNPNFELKNHQIEGIAWLQYLFNSEASGCLMADDMGLGKTLQILYLIDWHYRTHPDHNPYLIVAPVSLLENWEREYKRFFDAPRLKITVLRTSDVKRQFSKECINWLQSMDIILTSYETMRNAQLNFCAVEFDIIALDEAQKIKTVGTLVTTAAKALKGKFKIAMTGTPVENSLKDLWCIMDFCVPGLLGNAKSFTGKYESELKRENADIEAIGNEIHDLMGIYFKRRLKKDVAKDLPVKHEVKECQQMPSVQLEKYNQAIKDFKTGKEEYFLVTLQNIRGISEHPYVYDKTFEEHSTNELLETSARLIPTIKNLDEIKRRDEKVIVFAERLDTQRMLQRIFWERYSIPVKVINGATSVNPGHKNSRQATIDAFQAKEGFNIIIMSPIAAGMGLNVTAANHVIHFSRHWNPAKENQATDRAYRIGQTKDVYVYYPMATNKDYQTFDVTLDTLLSRKSELASSTIYPTEAAKVTSEELIASLINN